MQSFDVRQALAYLVTPPVRPRYQERTMARAYMAADDVCGRLAADRRHAAVARLDALAMDLSLDTSGSAKPLKIPLLSGALLCLMGALTLLLR